MIYRSLSKSKIKYSLLPEIVEEFSISNNLLQTFKNIFMYIPVFDTSLTLSTPKQLI